ncbi:uncharacterized protein LOC115568729 [Sparus aurata]|uniref:Uncharacterized LOC115568729 n=1 Tax=Sparus aurata TaxID=8175 RepID=A0A671XXE2_SPAAU|nr:uncharacterized protein LOC115568729 [Sparus aurata]
MIGRLAALILLCSLSHNIDVPPQIPLTVAELGDNLTLTCPVTGSESSLFYWYKMKFGFMVQTVAAGSSYKILPQGQFVNSRFTITKDDSLYFLHITNVTKEDEATYFCQSGAAYVMRFTNGTVLAVNDPKNNQKSISVQQSPVTALVEPGALLNLQCSLLSKKKENSVQCPGEHSVYWFRAGSGGSHPNIIYPQRNSSCDREDRSCVYRLSKTIESSADNGTYYCAVVTCGEILFGEGTKVEIRQDVCPLVIALGTLSACCVIVAVVVIISRSHKPVCKRCKASNRAERDRTPQDHPNNVDGEAVALNYVALDFPSRKRERWMNTRDSSMDCVYAGMSDCQ